MRLKNRIDLALVSTGPTETIDIGEPGGRPSAQLVVVKSGGGAVVIQGTDTTTGTFETAAEITVPEDGTYRATIPFDCPRYIRLSATGATLSVRV